MSELYNCRLIDKVTGIPVWLTVLVIGGPLVEMITGSYRVRNANAKDILGWKQRYRTFSDGIKEVVQEYKRRFAGTLLSRECFLQFSDIELLHRQKRPGDACDLHPAKESLKSYACREYDSPLP